MVYFKIILLAIENQLLHSATTLATVPGLIHASIFDSSAPYFRMIHHFLKQAIAFKGFYC